MRRLAFFLLFALLVGSGCEADHAEDIADFEAVMPVLEKHGVIDFIWTEEQAGCES